MDSLITAAGRALAAGDPLGALKRIALREDAPALALRGIERLRRPREIARDEGDLGFCDDTACAGHGFPRAKAARGALQ